MSAEHSSHSQAHGHDDHSHTGIYKKIGGVLLVCTVLTVVISWLPFDRATQMGIIVLLGLIVATFKAGLVAMIFMHLKGEKKIIWWTLTLCAAFFIVLILLPVITTNDTAGKHIAPPVPQMKPGAHGHGEAAHDAAHPEGAHAPSGEAAPAH